MVVYSQNNHYICVKYHKVGTIVCCPEPKAICRMPLLH